jgi:hypothetical protein
MLLKPITGVARALLHHERIPVLFGHNTGSADRWYKYVGLGHPQDVARLPHDGYGGFAVLHNERVWELKQALQ